MRIRSIWACGGHARPLVLLALLLLAACAGDSGLSPTASGTSAPLTDAELSRDDCFAHHSDCAPTKNGRLAFSRFIDFTGFAIYSAMPDGSDMRQLTTPVLGAYDDFSSDWSPDATNIVFERDYGDGTHQFFRVNADGTGLHQLTHCVDRCLGVANPAYSPNGRQIAFAEAFGDDASFTVGIWIMNADGSDPVQVTQRRVGTGSSDQWASWSPDGRKLAFTRFNDAAEPVNQQAIFVSNADGSEAHRITPWQLNAADADWSPDGRLLVVTSHYDIEPVGHEQLYLVHPDGSGLVRVTPSGLAQPSNIGGKFSPDGRRIVFRHEAGTGDKFDSLVYTMDLDGRNVELVSHDHQFYDSPSWGAHH